MIIYSMHEAGGQRVSLAKDEIKVGLWSHTRGAWLVSNLSPWDLDNELRSLPRESLTIQGKAIVSENQQRREMTESVRKSHFHSGWPCV
jgi:hypothetical protein